MGKDITNEEVLGQVRAELGAFGEKTVERMKANEAKVEELFSKIEKLSGAIGDQVRAKYFGALSQGKPLIMEADETVEAFVERLKGGVGGKRDQRGLAAARMLHALGATIAQGKPATFDSAIDIARGWDDDTLAGNLEDSRDKRAKLSSNDPLVRARAERSLSTQVLGNGAGFVQPELYQEIIDVLIAKAVVRSLGAKSLPMPGGTLDMAYMQSAATASYVGEAAGANASQPVEGRLQLARKIMQVVVALTKELFRESSFDVTALIRSHMVRVMAAREDLAFLRGDGSANTPKGITYWAGLSSAGGAAHSYNRTLATGAVTVDTITSDALKAMNLLESSNIPMTSCGWVMSPRDFYGLVSKRNATTQMPIWPELLAGTWYGYPVRRSTQIPKTLTGDGAGTGTGNKSEVYFSDFDSLVIAETKSLEINAYDGGAYVDPTGNLRSGITNREIVLAGDLSHDFGSMYRGDDCVVINSVDWGA